jgi:Xaa-Pro aminopeptidase
MTASPEVFRQRIANLQAALRRAGMQAVAVTAGDPHVSEYPSQHWEGRRWLSGFTGSLATLVVFEDRAALLPESIYWDQAEAQLEGTGIEVVRHPGGCGAGLLDWLPRQLPAGSTVAVDGNALALGFAADLGAALTDAGISLRYDLDLLGQEWSDRPPRPEAAVFEHPPRYAVTPRREKLAALRKAMSLCPVTHHLVSSLEDVAWLTNLRGRDSPNTPVFMAHLLVTADSAALFIDPGKVHPELAAALRDEGIAIEPYQDIATALGRLDSRHSLLLDPRRTTLGIRDTVGHGCSIIRKINPSTLLKSRKSAGEADNIREAMIEDGAAMCEFYADFEERLDSHRAITELDVAGGLADARGRRHEFIMPSFPTIAGFNAHGALPHYVASAETSVPISGDGLLLIDSGAHYLGGTTDITRVWPIGTVAPPVIRDVTMVLKAHIALTSTTFPRGTLSTMLDAIARAPMWREGMDYFHGTGHGVGYCLGVHEGPQTFRQAIPDATMAMEAGMVTSIEPAVYRPGRWGARIENLVLSVPANPPEGTTFGEFLEFETLTLCPIDTRCIDRALLRYDELAWLNRYHETVRSRLAPRLEGAALEWLYTRTLPI